MPQTLNSNHTQVLAVAMPSSLILPCTSPCLKTGRRKCSSPGVSIFVLGASAHLLAAQTPVQAPTFYRDVLPVLQAHCQECHRPGEAAPMSFLTYREVRPWAKAIRSAVLTQKMPPWFADPCCGKFANDRSLSASERDTLARWADAGAPEGDAKQAPPPRIWPQGWNLPSSPDAVLGMPRPFTVP